MDRKGGAKKWFWITFLGLPLLFLILVLIRLALSRKRELTGKDLLKKAYKGHIQILTPQHDVKKTWEHLQAFFATVFATKVHTMTAENIIEYCEEAGVEKNAIKNLKQELEKLEASQYGFQSSSFDEEHFKGLNTALNQVYHQFLEKIS